MLKYAETRVSRAPLPARPQPELNRKEAREALTTHFEKSFQHLAK